VDGRFTARVPLKAGPHTIGVAFLEKTHALNTRRLQNYVRSSSDTIDFSGYPHIDEVILTGRSIATGTGQTPSRRRIFVCTPPPPSRGQARAWTEEIALCRADPRDPGATCVSGGRVGKGHRTLMDFFQQGRKDGGSFQSGIDLALDVVLASPKFIFRADAIRLRAPRFAETRRPERPASITATWGYGSVDDWRRGCRSSSGAVSRTTSCSMPARAARWASRTRRAPGAAHAVGSQGAVADRQLRRPVAAAAQPEEQAAELACDFPTSTTTSARRC
jgi:hypothetical protein